MTEPAPAPRVDARSMPCARSLEVVWRGKGLWPRCLARMIVAFVLLAQEFAP